MSGIMQLLLSGRPQVASDPNFEYTTLLLPGNGTNGAQNNTFLDSSTNNFTITRNGNTTQGTFSPFSQTGWGAYFDGTGDYLSVPDAAAFTLGTSDFCMESWVYPVNAGTGASESILGQWSAGSYGWIFQYRSNALLMYYSTNGSTTTNAINASATVLNNAWNHIAFVRSGNTLSAYVNGTRVSTNASFTASIVNSSSTVNVGRNGDNSEYVTGYLSNTRLVVGSSVYDPTQASFTVPTAPLTAISGTSLLTCQSNRFIDNSTNNFTITRNGDVSVQAFSPFNPTAAWSAATNGGSGYFDGSGDYLNGPSTGQFAPTGNFTISMWIYPTSFAAAYYVLAGSWNTGTSDEWLIQYDNTGAIRFLTTTDSTFSAAGVIKLNQWQFLSISRTGNTLTGYVNGTSFRSYTLTGTVGSATKVVYIGAQQGTTWPYAGYMADFRLVAGSAESATPPTAPATAISGTNMLLNFTNAGIYDATSKNDLETVGNAQISTTQSKFGGSSIAFDGTGDYLTSPANPLCRLMSGDFTVEMWVRLAASQSNVGLVSSFTTNNGWVVRLDTTTVVFSYGTGGASTVISNSASLSTGVWYHIAWTKSGTTLRSFVDGTQVGANHTVSSAVDTTNTGLQVGRTHTVTNDLNGFINDLRITKGVARYTANFTPPTVAFPLL